MAALGLGGLLGGRLVLSRPVTAAVIAATIVGVLRRPDDEPRDRDRDRRPGPARAGGRGREHPGHRAAARRRAIDDPRRRRIGRRDPDLADVPALRVRVRGGERPIRCPRSRLDRWGSSPCSPSSCWPRRSAGSCVPRPACLWSRRSRPTSSGPATTPSGRATGSTRPGRGSSSGSGSTRTSPSTRCGTRSPICRLPSTT